MTVADLVKVTQYLTCAEDVPAYVKVCSRFLGEALRGPSSCSLTSGSGTAWPPACGRWAGRPRHLFESITARS